jgi:hypothetical protein
MLSPFQSSHLDTPTEQITKSQLTSSPLRKRSSVDLKVVDHIEDADKIEKDRIQVIERI